MKPAYLYLVRMDVAHDHEAAFNEIYDAEHVPALLSVPGVRRVGRYRNPSPTDPRYLAAYEIDGHKRYIVGERIRPRLTSA